MSNNYSMRSPASGPADSYWPLTCLMNVCRALKLLGGDAKKIAQSTLHPIEFQDIFHPSDFSEASRESFAYALKLAVAAPNERA